MARGTWGGALDRHPMKVRITWTDDVHVHQTGFTLRSAGTNISSPEEVAADVLPWVDTHFRTILQTNQRILGIDVVDMVTAEGGGVSPANMLGTRVVAESNRAPSFLCIVVSMKGELRTRYGQGRMFWPIIGEDSSDGDVINATARTLFGGVMEALAARFIGNTLTGHNLINVHGVLPPKGATPSRPARPEIPPSWYDVTTLRVNNALTFLRSRKAGVGS